ncbi:MAG: sigma-54 dependent transcriptional regulator, partial [Candidatus Cloacimonetes bacterium]|nr:sigma-54 dependent transcriptional regulator [Candidatus Cloacimonadota bacterium]
HDNLILKNRIREQSAYPRLIGKSHAISEILDVVKMVAPTNTTILITGESGTGKEIVAEAIHDLSPRKKNTFIRINCAALPEQLIESELFGFEKGAFTGAIKRTRGKFEISDKGSILLDEISEMNLDLQAKLLRVIQEKEIMRIGSERPQKIDVRVIATSNLDLTEEVSKGNFREDLFFRLNIIPIHLPPLRQRMEDIPLLVESFMKQMCFDLGVPLKVLQIGAMDALLQYHWPGNIRELQNALERAIITSPGTVIKTEAFQFINIRREGKPEAGVNPVVSSQHNLSGKTIAEVEREMIYQTLEKTGGNRTESARVLGVTTRTLRNKLKLYESESSA